MTHFLLRMTRTDALSKFAEVIALADANAQGNYSSCLASNHNSLTRISRRIISLVNIFNLIISRRFISFYPFTSHTCLAIQSDITYIISNPISSSGQLSNHISRSFNHVLILPLCVVIIRPE